jgi:multiple sugar transport system substrate-binding protein
MEVQPDGRTVALNSKNTIEAVKFNNVLWKEVFDEGGLAWDDSNNNRAFLSSEISLTGNAPSIYVAARQKFPDVYKGTNHGHYPPGPAGRFYWLPAWNSVVMKLSKNQKVAKDFIRFYMDRARSIRTSRRWTRSGSRARRRTATTAVEEGSQDAVFPETLASARRSATRAARRKATEVLSKYIIVRHVRQAIQGMKPRGRVRGRRGAEEDL